MCVFNLLVIGPNGLCVRAPPGEPGELVGKIINSDPIKRFDGYSTKAATEKKVSARVLSIKISILLNII